MFWPCKPSQAVCEGGGARHVAFPIDDAAVAARTQRPERGGRAWQIQTDVPERVYRRGNAMADLTGNIRLQSACEDLVYDAVTVVGVVGLLPIIITFAVSV